MFGDAYWSPSETMPLHTELGEKITNNMCFLLYYKQDDVNSFSDFGRVYYRLVLYMVVLCTNTQSLAPAEKTKQKAQ